VDTTLTIISIASGSRGLERGIEHAGQKLRVAAYVEIEAFIIANLVAEMESSELDAAPIWADVKTFPANAFRGKIHGITGGYPCQPFSNAGKRKGSSDSRHIFPYILRIIETIKPLWCFFENVDAHLTLGFDEVYRSLHDLGYTVESGIYSAEEVGAPHQRKRLFILAKMEYSNASKSKGIDQRNDEKFTNLRSSSKMANANSYNRGANNRKFHFKPNKTKKAPQGQDRKRMRAEFGNSNSALSNWPAKPEQKQYEWEEPRTIKSGVGCSIDGYNFRTDLLRMYGNGVVPQTAALAWIELNKKMERNYL
jgi:site-specific DNA-cytosine methylase